MPSTNKLARVSCVTRRAISSRTVTSSKVRSQNLNQALNYWALTLLFCAGKQQNKQNQKPGKKQNYQNKGKGKNNVRI